MRRVLQKLWRAEHSQRHWIWNLYVKDTRFGELEEAAIIYADDRDGPFNLSIWDWAEEEYSEYVGFDRLKDAKLMGKILAGVKFVSYPQK